MTTARVVRGEVVFPATERPSPFAKLLVQVEDVSFADAPSVVVGEQELNVGELEGGGGVLFTIEIPAHLIDPRHFYSVRAHLDASGSGQVEVGDLVSTRSYPVLTRGYGDVVIVDLQLVSPMRR